MTHFLVDDGWGELALVLVACIVVATVVRLAVTLAAALLLWVLLTAFDGVRALYGDRGLLRSNE